MNRFAKKSACRIGASLSALPWLAGAAILLTAAAPSFAQADIVLQPVGNKGGSPFFAHCRTGDVLTGVELWAGDHVDAIKPICIPAVKGQFQEYPTRYGGNGGKGPRQIVCPNDSPVVIGMDVTAEVSAVNNIHLYCGLAISAAQRFPFPMAAFDGPVSRGEENCSVLGSCFSREPEMGILRCEAGLIAVGIVGRAGKFLDALGLICGAPPSADGSRGLGLKPVVRIKPAGASSADAAAAPVDICDSARRARERNSPATAGLEAQCAAQTTRNNQKAKDEQQAVNIDRQRVTDLAIRGQVIGLKDPGIMSMRKLFGGPSYGGAFDAGLAAAEGQTEWGPGKEQLMRSIEPPRRYGFAAAVDYTIDRNRNAERVMIGSQIAQADPGLAEARTKNADPRFWLGFDIATAIFGDPRLGAQGNTALGPGSLGVRAALSQLGQQGFDSAIKLHLSRTYAE